MVTLAWLAVGCGSAHVHVARPVKGTVGSSATAVPAIDVQVIRGWSDALRRGDVRAAAKYFALPSVLVNGIGGGALALPINTRAEAEAANATLPCGARFISAGRRGRFVNALFRLTGRRGPGGSNCGRGAGLTARTNFLIVHGRIVEWVRAPDEPGDNGTPRAPGSGPSSV